MQLLWKSFHLSNLIWCQPSDLSYLPSYIALGSWWSLTRCNPRLLWHSRQKAFVSATAPVLAAFRGGLGLLLSQWGSITPFWTSFMFRTGPYVWLYKAWLITKFSGWLSPEENFKGKKGIDIFPLLATKVQSDSISKTVRIVGGK
jgi:hypothetical protein